MKRQADKQISKDDPDSRASIIRNQSFINKQASEETLKERNLKKLKVSADKVYIEPDPVNIFSKGFLTSKPLSSISCSRSSDFSLKLSNPDNSANKPVIPKAQSSITPVKRTPSSMDEHQLTPSDDSSNSQDLYRKLNRSNSGGSDELSTGEQYTDTFFKKISRLNQAVSSWIKTQVSKNPLCDLTPIFKDYSKYLKDILEEFSIPSSPSNSHTPANQLSVDQETPLNETTPVIPKSNTLVSVSINYTQASTFVATTTIVTSTFIGSTFTTSSLSIATTPSIPSIYSLSNIQAPRISSSILTSSFITRSLTTPSFTTANIPPLPSNKPSTSETKSNRFNPLFKAAPSHAATGQVVGAKQLLNTIVPSAPPLKLDHSLLDALKQTRKDASSGQETQTQTNSPISALASKSTLPFSLSSQPSATVSTGSIFKGLNFAHLPQTTQSFGLPSILNSSLPAPTFKNFSGIFNPTSGHSTTTKPSTNSNSENVNSSGEEDDGDNKNEEDKPVTPPACKIDSENTLFTCKTKLFRKDSESNEFRELGIAILRLIRDPNVCQKTQLLIRDVSGLAKILLNVMIYPKMPLKLIGDNKIMLVCPNVLLEENNGKAETKTKTNLITFLLRVKTPELAKDLLEHLNQSKMLISENV